MFGLEEFLGIFGGITLLNIVEIIIAVAFLIFIGMKVRDYLIKRHEAERIKNEELQEALIAVRKYPEYRQQSIQIQAMLEGEIQEIRGVLTENMTQIKEMREDNERRERNKLRDLLLQNYRYYTNPKTNPNQTWTKVESETFWELAHDYDAAGGNGHMHRDVYPAMEKLTIVD